jgi:tetrapyrrole methylase family protein/MazG family protein
LANELGDLVFALVNLARKVGVDPEQALRRTVIKFIDRFEYIEKSLKREDRAFSETDLDEMERLWQEAKKSGK